LTIDQALIAGMVRHVRELGAQTLFGPPHPKVMHRADLLLFCWGRADDAALVEQLNSPTLQVWRGANPDRRIVVIAYPPGSPTKETACQAMTYGVADLVLEKASATFGTKLAAILSLVR
jgi:hypothetical protein